MRARVWRGFLGFLDAGRDVGRRDGFHLRSGRKAEAQERLLAIVMRDASGVWRAALPFAMDPVVYDFAINERGTFADLAAGEEALLPAGYYSLMLPASCGRNRDCCRLRERAELDRFGAACRSAAGAARMVADAFRAAAAALRSMKRAAGPLDRFLLAEIRLRSRCSTSTSRTDLRSGPDWTGAEPAARFSARIEDVRPDDVFDAHAARSMPISRGWAKQLCRRERWPW